MIGRNSPKDLLFYTLGFSDPIKEHMLARNCGSPYNFRYFGLG
jgi:hypothetical protein